MSSGTDSHNGWLWSEMKMYAHPSTYDPSLDSLHDFDFRFDEDTKVYRKKHKMKRDNWHLPWWSLEVNVTCTPERDTATMPVLRIKWSSTTLAETNERIGGRWRRREPARFKARQPRFLFFFSFIKMNDQKNKVKVAKNHVKNFNNYYN